MQFGPNLLFFLKLNILYLTYSKKKIYSYVIILQIDKYKVENYLQ
jgi:hypothetical protein